MKKVNILIASVLVFAGFAYANPAFIKQQATTAKKDDKTATKTDKKEVKKVPSKKKPEKKATTPTK